MWTFSTVLTFSTVHRPVGVESSDYCLSTLRGSSWCRRTNTTNQSLQENKSLDNDVLLLQLGRLTDLLVWTLASDLKALMYIRNQMKISSFTPVCQHLPTLWTSGPPTFTTARTCGPPTGTTAPTCLSLQFEDPEEAIVPSTGNEALVFVPGDTLQMYIVRDRDLCRQRRRQRGLLGVFAQRSGGA